LIDEYDYPIVEQLENPELATEIRKTLRSFYNVLKGVESFRGFTFITGVTEFGQNSIFAFLNNLNDLTFDPEYSTVCGFTLHEFDSLFLGHMETLLECFKSEEALPREATVADLRGLILDWYDGYSWDGETRVLNPWSILNVLDNKNFSDYWVQSGCFPSFLAQSLRSERSKFNLFKAKKTLNRRFNPFGLDKDLDPFSILFQSGYLTFDRVEFKYGDELYFLKIPNLEVKSCFVPVVFSLNPPTRVMSAKKQAEAMVSSLFNLDVTGFQDSFGKFIGFFYPDYREVDAPYFRRLFEAAMVFADRDFQKKAPLGQGRYAYILKAPDETRFAIDINHSRLTEKEREKGLNPHSKIKKMANDSIKRMGPKKIDPIFKVPGRDFHKVAVVVNEKAEVFCLIQKEEFS
jgi:hypothetical protein